jgi:protein-S-isoprenylcysteine O-methyltransferase Ste14
MRKRAIVLYSVLAYLIFFVAFLYFTGFLLNMVVDKSIDTGTADSLPQALLIDPALIALFGAQHSLMMRYGFKRRLNKLVPRAAERSTYVLATGSMFVLVSAFWQPIPAVVWQIDSMVIQMLLYMLFAGGLVIVLVSAFLMGHFEYFGLEEAYRALNDLPLPEPKFRMPLFYRVVRHPMQLGLLLIFWVTPYMSAGHLLFAAGMTAFIFIGLHFEERDLIQRFGDVYRQYRARTPLLLPIPTRQLRQIASDQIEGATQILER